jgi:hypothetical protein
MRIRLGRKLDDGRDHECLCCEKKRRRRRWERREREEGPKKGTRRSGPDMNTSSLRLMRCVSLLLEQSKTRNARDTTRLSLMLATPPFSSLPFQSQRPRGRKNCREGHPSPHNRENPSFIHSTLLRQGTRRTSTSCPSVPEVRACVECVGHGRPRNFHFRGWRCGMVWERRLAASRILSAPSLPHPARANPLRRPPHLSPIKEPHRSPGLTPSVSVESERFRAICLGRPTYGNLIDFQTRHHNYYH